MGILINYGYCLSVATLGGGTTVEIKYLLIQVLAKRNKRYRNITSKYSNRAFS